MNMVHLTASRFFGGPERQMLGLGESLPGQYRSVYASFSEGGRCQEFLGEASRRGFATISLRNDTPRFRAAVAEITEGLHRHSASILLCHGYKADLLGRPAARRARVPVVAVSRGWTGENLKVSLYETADRFALRWMDRVVSVSEGQARKVFRTGVAPHRVLVIRNAINPDRFDRPDIGYRQKLKNFFPRPRTRIVGAAGRLSPEKGFDALVEAARNVVRDTPSVGFVLFGEGPQRPALEERIAHAGLGGNFILAGHRTDLDKFFPFLDLFVQSSRREGLPNVLLEAFAAGVPVVATNVGGTGEVVEEGVSGLLVRPGRPLELADAIREVLTCDASRREMGCRGRERVLREFTFAAQAQAYQRLFAELLGEKNFAETDSPLRRVA